MAKTFLHTRRQSFIHAFSGICYVLRTQTNARIHLIATILAIGLGFWLNISLVEWAILSITIAGVWAAESFNTAIEAAVDLSSPQLHPLAKIAKDSAAAGVLFTAIGAVAVGLALFGPPFIEKIAKIF